jgi:hypothetical protein
MHLQGSFQLQIIFQLPDNEYVKKKGECQFSRFENWPFKSGRKLLLDFLYHPVDRGNSDLKFFGYQFDIIIVPVEVGLQNFKFVIMHG